MMSNTCPVKSSIAFPQSAGIVGQQYNNGRDVPLRVLEMKLPGWLGHPYTHAAALLLSLMAALAVVAFMVGTLEYTKIRGRLLLTALLVAGYFLTTLVATATPKDGAMRWLFAATFGWATLALFLLLLGLWATPDSNEFWKSAAGVTFLAFGMSFAGLALGLGSGVRSARILSGLSAILAALMSVMTVLGIALEIGAGPYWWAFGLLVMCWLGASAALVALRFRRRRNTDG